jgi:hypothetical protein
VNVRHERRKAIRQAGENTFGVSAVRLRTGRKAIRQAGENTFGVSAVRLRTGQAARLINLSASGASIETDAGLTPGSRVDIVMVARDDIRPTRTTVVYARVSRVHPTHGARYQIGLRIEGKHLEQIAQAGG